MKRVFGTFEAVFDGIYLLSAAAIGLILLATASCSGLRIVGGAMALVLSGGDAFHLIPRMRVILSQNEESLRTALGRGKQITSITMTVFYILLWELSKLLSPAAPGLWDIAVYLLALGRIALCLMPQNRWTDRYPPVSWGIWRNVPFFLLGLLVALRMFLIRSAAASLNLMWLAIILSFAFYLPVVLWANDKPKLGMLMLPKTCCYIWMLVMCLSL